MMLKQLRSVLVFFKTQLRRFWLLHKERELIKTIRKNDFSKVSELVEKGVDPNAVFRHKKWGLYDLFGERYAVRMFFALIPFRSKVVKFDVKLSDRKGVSLLEVAINMRDGTFFDLILARYPDCSKAGVLSSAGKGIVLFAVEHVYVSADETYLGLEFVKKLLSKGIVWQKGEFPGIDQNRVEQICEDPFNGIDELAKYLVDLLQK